MNKSWSLLLAVGLLCTPIVGRAANKTSTVGSAKIDGKTVKLARYAKAYIGQGNVKVEVAPYQMGDKDGAILVFHGIEGDWDGKALNHRVAPKNDQGEFDYVTQYKGEDWHTLVVRNDYDGKLTYQLFVPGVQDGIMLAPSDGAAQLINPHDIVEQYQHPRKSAE